MPTYEEILKGMMLLTWEEIQIIIRQHNEARLQPSRTELALIEAQRDKTLNYPIIKGGVCPECKGEYDNWKCLHYQRQGMGSYNQEGYEGGYCDYCKIGKLIDKASNEDRGQTYNSHTRCPEVSCEYFVNACRNCNGTGTEPDVTLGESIKGEFEGE